MPIKETGTYRCDKCHKRFEWTHFEIKRQQMKKSGFYDVDTLPAGRTLTHTFAPVEDNHFSVGVFCPFCHYDNHFIYESEEIT